VRIYWLEQSPFFRLPLTNGGLFDTPYWLGIVLERINFVFQRVENEKMKELKTKQKKDAIVDAQIKQLMSFAGGSAGIR